MVAKLRRRRPAVIGLPTRTVVIMKMIDAGGIVTVTRPALIIRSLDNRVTAAIRCVARIIRLRIMGTAIQQQQTDKKYLFN